ncbi:unnamed protein product [Porites evermanni]|uniref:Uncharacterized protein n=1 Tax=Porites evermanni TaxID=104178 RepID=A0ABN8SYX0_9CNID|nr:unnamed protein product [Porites evermanni]
MKSSAVSLQATTMTRKQDKWTAKVSPVNVSRMCLKASKPTGPEICAKESSPSVDSSWFIVRLWNRGLVSVGLRKPSSVPRQTAKRPQYQRLADVPVNVFEICMSEINQTGPETSFCTTKAARRLAESQWFTTKLWNKGVASIHWIRSNETQEKARNLTNLYLTRVVTTMLHWTWQDTFDVMTIILVTDYCCTALYLAVPYIFNIITRLIRMLIRKWRLYRENQQRKLEEERERLRQEELARERASQPKPWRPKQPRRRKANFCGRLQKW